MMKQISLDDAVSLVPDATALGIGGVLLKRKPMRLLAALVDAGRSELAVSTFLGSLDVELLAAAGALAEFRGGYVGFEQLGFAPAFRAAVERNDVRYIEYSEFLFVSGLRAAAAGVPFFPAKGGMGSELLEGLGIVEIEDPYSGVPVLAVPTLSPEISILHAEEADREGNVRLPASRDFLSDFDVNLARASDRVIVTAERVVDALDGLPALFAHEVSFVVEVPDGARPTSLPGSYIADVGTIRSYLDAPSVGALLDSIR